MQKDLREQYGVKNQGVLKAAIVNKQCDGFYKREDKNRI